MRRAARVDDNQSEIVSALRAIGCSVWIIGLPVDLLVGYQGKTALMEVKVLTGRKNPKPKKHTALQTEFLAWWQGGTVATVTDVESAIMAALTMKGCE